MGDYSAYGMLGIGNYLGEAEFFIEYGLGISYAWDAVGVFAQASNWDGDWYVTPGISFAL